MSTSQPFGIPPVKRVRPKATTVKLAQALNRRSARNALDDMIANYGKEK